MALVPLSYVHTAPPLVCPALSVAGTHHATSEGESTVLWARQLPFDRRQVNFLVSETVLRRRSLWRNVADDPFAAYQEAAKVMSVKNGSGSQTVSWDDVVVTGSHRATVVKMEPSSSLQGKKPKSGGVTTRSVQQSAEISRSAGSLATALSNLNLKVIPQDGTVLTIGDPSGVVQVLQGGLLRTVSEHYHLGERLSNEGLAALREELEDLKRQLFAKLSLCTGIPFCEGVFRCVVHPSVGRSTPMVDLRGKGILYEEDDEPIQLFDEDDAHTIREYRMSLIGKVLNLKKQNMEKLIQYMPTQ
ncbi:hypothetical protein Bca52824_074900 [Brassica carinata]|uniref:Uncharacterized protein n=1 Tax=Brassica carinata TaxID=52824 RepID=A0A8X7TXF3_BRACI|nr:hypothetical protein Bca52824_074900 [Brassica carinata]